MPSNERLSVFHMIPAAETAAKKQKSPKIVNPDGWSILCITGRIGISK
jgi:hypothetical protein